eukprot:RCo020869
MLRCRLGWKRPWPLWLKGRPRSAGWSKSRARPRWNPWRCPPSWRCCGRPHPRWHRPGGACGTPRGSRNWRPCWQGRKSRWPDCTQPSPRRIAMRCFGWRKRGGRASPKKRTISERSSVHWTSLLLPTPASPQVSPLPRPLHPQFRLGRQGPPPWTPSELSGSSSPPLRTMSWSCQTPLTRAWRLPRPRPRVLPCPRGGLVRDRLHDGSPFTSFLAGQAPVRGRRWSEAVVHMVGFGASVLSQFIGMGRGLLYSLPLLLDCTDDYEWVLAISFSHSGVPRPFPVSKHHRCFKGLSFFSCQCVNIVDIPIVFVRLSRAIGTVLCCACTAPFHQNETAGRLSEC